MLYGGDTVLGVPAPDMSWEERSRRKKEGPGHEGGDLEGSRKYLIYKGLNGYLRDIVPVCFT